MGKKLTKFCIILAIMGIFAHESSALYVIDTNKTHELNSYFEGNWNVKTIVTHSSCPYIIVGSTTISKIEIKKDLNRYKGYWSGGNWSKSEFRIDQLSETEAISERVTKNSVENTVWEAVLTDHLSLGDDNKIRSESIANQFKNGKYVGEYKTYSVLSKVK